MVIDFIADYYKNIENYPVQSQVKPGYLLTKLPDTAPYCPESLEDVLKDVTDSIIPGLTNWQSPNFFAYFQANASTAGFVGEMLCTGLNVVGNGGGVLHGSTCEAIVCTLAAARDRTLRNIGAENIANWNSLSNFRCLSTSFSSEFSLSPQSLEDAIENDIKAGYVPLFICATVGTTACGAVDPVMDLGKIARKYNLWFHIDAAYAGSACICPEFRHYLDGIELADSLSMNPHKWLLTNMECCCLWVKQPRLLIESLSSNPEYLKNNASESNAVVDYKDWQIALSRRFRALKLWVVIRRHGIDNLMFHIRSHVNLAKRFESLVAKDSRFEHNDACKASELNRKLLAAVNESGRAFMTHSVVGGLRHVDDLWKLIQEKAADLVQKVVPLENE
ncbi:tyrosine decarboxylase [Salix suchowensis]|nr:tyrosine decarboxylase [Salix suchowensis]